MTDDMNANWPDALEGPVEMTPAALRDAAASYDTRARNMSAAARYCDDPYAYRDEVRLAESYASLSATLSQAATLMENLR